MKQLLSLVFLTGSLLLPLNVPAAPQPYFYPFVNPYEATVMEVPKELEVGLPEEVPTKEFTLRVFPEREIPKVFWYEHGLICSLAYQDHKAPLVFVIAGSGSRYDTLRTLKLQKAFYQGGFHVISITSPTHMDFVVNASSGMPGDSMQDAGDLYRVMELAYEEVREKIEVSGFALAGYSLGGFNAAFVAKLDEEKKLFNFRKVLLINPPLSLYDAVSILDRLLEENIPGGMDNFEPWFRDMFKKFSQASKGVKPGGLSGEFMHIAYKRLPPNEENLAALIGLVFRMNGADMMFTADVMNGGGYIVPRNATLTSTTSLTRYAIVSYNTRFIDYFNEYFFPNRQKRDHGMTRQALLQSMSLRSIEPYLRNTGKICLIHNEDDIILKPGDIDYFEEVFRGRARIFPTGGHMGNMFHPDVVSSMIDFLTGKEN